MTDAEDPTTARGGTSEASGARQRDGRRAEGVGRGAREAGTPPRSERARTIAAFDFDKTLSTRDNVLPFLRLVVGRGRLNAALLRASPKLAAAALDARRRDAAKAALVRHTLTGFDAARLDEIAVEFADDVRARHLRPDVVERLGWHRDQGHETVIVSASFGNYLEPIARELAVDAVLATELEVEEGRLTGRLAGANVRGAEKVRRLDEWLGTGDAEVWAYGDSRGDDELLARADHAVRIGVRR